ncbi:hypothetical protein ACGFYU_00690 [Streptomyces sp. NPDC048337]
MLGQVGPETRQRARRKLIETLRPYESDGAVWLRSTSWLVTAARRE